MWSSLRPQLDAILMNEPEKRPATYHDAVAIAVNGVLLCDMGSTTLSSCHEYHVEQRRDQEVHGGCSALPGCVLWTCHGLV